jgi:hypothetical protein
MSTTEPIAYPSDVRADLEAVIEHLATGEPLDIDVVRRVQERSRRTQEELVKKYGIREIAVELIRETRDEE